jgi:hypothetical protein
MAAVMASFKVQFPHLSRGTKRKLKESERDNQCPSQCVNQSLPTYNSEVLSLQPTCSVSLTFEGAQFWTDVYVHNWQWWV